MKLYVVHRTSPGYAREDPSTSDVVGVYDNPETATAVKLAVGYSGLIDEVELNSIPKGIVDFLVDIGYTKGIVP